METEQRKYKKRFSRKDLLRACKISRTKDWSLRRDPRRPRVLVLKVGGQEVGRGKSIRTAGARILRAVGMMPPLRVAP